ncbi:DUF6366 family protein [Pseudogracilibacillus sp. SE30717A]|uniref:DUF6366 family protein n=1 Tax=Pseudogracilibacillus sp. SE30717A TaxID=3098293 RepID=UPI00300E0CF8
MNYDNDRTNDRSLETKIITTKKENTDNNISDAFDSSRIANFSDDPVGIMGWKGTGLLLITVIVGFVTFKVFFS